MHFRRKDYADASRSKTMVLDAHEFIRRFLLHVLPRGFVRIRHYGFLANRHRQAKVELCRKLLGVCRASEDPAATETPPPAPPPAKDCRERCPLCGQGHMVIIEELKPVPWSGRDHQIAVRKLPWDTS